MGCEIKLTGTALKMPVSKEDGTGEILLKSSMNPNVPLGLKSLGETMYKVMVGNKAWKKIKDDITKDTFYIINGEPKAVVTTKGAPFITIVAFQVQTLPQDPKAAKKVESKVIKEEPKKVDITPQKVENKQEKKALKDKTKPLPFTPWFHDERVKNSLVDMDVFKVELIEKAHMYPFTGKLFGSTMELPPIAVCPLGDGQYKLVAGIKSYISAKMYNKHVQAFIYDKSVDEFNKEFNVMVGNADAISKSTNTEDPEGELG